MTDWMDSQKSLRSRVHVGCKRQGKKEQKKVQKGKKKGERGMEVKKEDKDSAKSRQKTKKIGSQEGRQEIQRLSHFYRTQVYLGPIYGSKCLKLTH